jgi:hypothetical protein
MIVEPICTAVPSSFVAMNWAMELSPASHSKPSASFADRRQRKSTDGRMHRAASGRAEKLPPRLPPNFPGLGGIGRYEPDTLLAEVPGKSD